MRKVLFINHVSSEKVGGAEKVLLDVLTTIDTRVICPVLLCPPIAEDSAFNAIKNSIAVYQRPFGPLVFKNRLKGILRIAITAFAMFFYMRKIVKKEKIDLIYANTLIAAFFALLPATILKKRFIYHEHGLPSLRKGSLWDRCFPVVIKKATAIIAISHAVKKALIDKGVDEHKITVIHNGIDLLRATSPRPFDIYKEFNIDRDHKVVGKVAHIMPWKGHMTLLRAIPAVLKEMPKVTFVFLGNNREGNENYFEGLQDFIKKSGIDRNIVFAGFRKDAFDIMGAFDILVHASDEEPFGLIFLEAMLLKKPVIATNAGAAPEIIQPGMSGLLFQKDNYIELSKHLIALLKDQTSCRDMGLCGYEIVRRDFSLTQQVKQIQSLLSEVCVQTGTD